MALKIDSVYFVLSFLRENKQKTFLIRIMLPFFGRGDLTIKYGHISFSLILCKKINYKNDIDTNVLVIKSDLFYSIEISNFESHQSGRCRLQSSK